MIEHVTVGPFGLFFTNVNTEMRLPGHSHTARLTLVYQNAPTADGHPTRGFPAFADTYAALRNHLLACTQSAFRDSTNEEVARRLAAAFQHYCPPVIAAWGGRYALAQVHLDVEGVEDKIGHAEGTTRYTVTLDPHDQVLLPEEPA
jgi:hypothetical protein